MKRWASIPLTRLSRGYKLTITPKRKGAAGGSPIPPSFPNRGYEPGFQQNQTNPLFAIKPLKQERHAVAVSLIRLMGHGLLGGCPHFLLYLLFTRKGQAPALLVFLGDYQHRLWPWHLLVNNNFCSWFQPVTYGRKQRRTSSRIWRCSALSPASLNLSRRVKTFSVAGFGAKTVICSPSIRVIAA